VTPTDSERVATCIADVDDWMRNNRLQLNIDKTDLLWCSSSRRQHQLQSAPLSFGGNNVAASSVVCKRGVFVGTDLSPRHQHHLDAITAQCFGALRQLHNIRCHVSVAIISLVTSPTFTRLDNCNSILFGLPEVFDSRLQSFQNATACVMFSLRRTAHVTDALNCLHWLQVPEHPLHVPTCARFSRLQVDAPRCRLSSLGNQAFPVLGATAFIWNESPTDITSALLASAFSASA
jgi:hypothetical protein